MPGPWQAPALLAVALLVGACGCRSGALPRGGGVPLGQLARRVPIYIYITSEKELLVQMHCGVLVQAPEVLVMSAEPSAGLAGQSASVGCGLLASAGLVSASVEPSAGLVLHCLSPSD